MSTAPDRARRDILKLTGAGLLGAGVMARTEAVAAQQTSARSLTNQLAVTGQGASRRLIPAARYGGADQPPRPATAKALTREWHQGRMQALFDAIQPQGVDAVLLRNVNNASYFVGYWVFPSERPQAAFKNRSDAAPWLFHPRSYAEIVQSTWHDGAKSYFDFPHADGAFPNEGIVRPGPAVDLFAFLLEGLRDKTIQGTKLGVDGELYPSELRKVAAILPNVEIVNIAPAIRDLRIVKTPEELALYSRSYIYNDRAQAFIRDYVLTYGTDVTDLEVESAAQLWLSDLLYTELELEGGRVNEGAATRASVRVRTGRANGSPHPNQPYFTRFGPNLSTQATSVVKINGCGGENYRTFLTAKPDGSFDSHAERLWETSRRSCDIQVELQAAGVRANEIARAIHQHQVDQGLARYIYHRASHGLAFEGHFPPYIALGDATVLPLNSALSQEPGLYDPETGFGFNWSDTVVTGNARGYRLSAVPYSREWSLLRL
jgi:Xaa-Pro dipeptidase